MCQKHQGPSKNRALAGQKGAENFGLVLSKALVYTHTVFQRSPLRSVWFGKEKEELDKSKVIENSMNL